MISRGRTVGAASALVCAVVLIGGCGGSARDGGATGQTSPISLSPGPASATTAQVGPGTPTAAGPAPPMQACVNPSTPLDVTLGEYLAIDATIVPGHATSDGSGATIPLTDVKVLWAAARNPKPPQSIEEGNLSLADAEGMFTAGRYILLLGSGHAGHWYLAMGYSGAFVALDAQGSTLTELCATYSNDGTAHPPSRAPGSITRKKLLALVAAARLPDPMYSPPA